MTKSTEHFQVFGKDWFIKHQDTLLWLCNTKVVKKWFRWVLGITKQDFPIGKEIAELAPNYISHSVKRIGRERVQVTTEFKSGQPYAQHLYEAFRPVWWLMHFFDWVILDRCVPDWSFGFNSLTANPLAGANSPADGIVSRQSVDESFSSIRGGAGIFVDMLSASSNPQLTSSGTTNQYGRMDRCIFCFDTSSLTSGATISATVLSLFGVVASNGLGSPDLHIAGATPSSTSQYVSSDYGQCQTTSFGSVAFGSFLTSYNNITLNASGVSNISKTGVSKYSAQLSWDILNSFTGTWASSAQSRFLVNMADNGSNQPKLVVTYAIAANLVRTVSASVSRAASRSISMSRLSGYLRKPTVSVSNGAFRLTTLVGLKTIVRAISVSVSNATSRLTSLSRLAAYGRKSTAIVSNAAGRLATIAKVFGTSRALSVTVSNAASRFASAVRNIKFMRGVSVSVSNSAFRLARITKLLVNGLSSLYTDKFTRQNTTYKDKFTP
jgi:hypothetical protein